MQKKLVAKNHNICKEKRVDKNREISFKPTMCVMMLYEPFSLIFILTEPLKMNKENIPCLFHNYLH